jgi:hypothetical protein
MGSCLDKYEDNPSLYCYVCGMNVRHILEVCCAECYKRYPSRFLTREEKNRIKIKPSKK